MRSWYRNKQCYGNGQESPESVRLTAVLLLGLLGAESSELYSTTAASCAPGSARSPSLGSSDIVGMLGLSVAMPPSRAILLGPPPTNGKRRLPSLLISAIVFSTGFRTVSTVGGFVWFIAKRATSVRCAKTDWLLSGYGKKPLSAHMYISKWCAVGIAQRGNLCKGTTSRAWHRHNSDYQPFDNTS